MHSCGAGWLVWLDGLSSVQHVHGMTCTWMKAVRVLASDNADLHGCMGRAEWHSADAQPHATSQPTSYLRVTEGTYQLFIL